MVARANKGPCYKFNDKGSCDTPDCPYQHRLFTVEEAERQRGKGGARNRSRSDDSDGSRGDGAKGGERQGSPYPTRYCRFYGTENGCRMGEECRFLHETPPPGHEFPPLRGDRKGKGAGGQPWWQQAKGPSDGSSPAQVRCCIVPFGSGSEVGETRVLDEARDNTSAHMRSLPTECHSSGCQNGTHALQTVASSWREPGSVLDAPEFLSCMSHRPGGVLGRAPCSPSPACNESRGPRVTWRTTFRNRRTRVPKIVPDSAPCRSPRGDMSRGQCLIAFVL